MMPLLLPSGDALPPCQRRGEYVLCCITHSHRARMRTHVHATATVHKHDLDLCLFHCHQSDYCGGSSKSIFTCGFSFCRSTRGNLFTHNAVSTRVNTKRTTEPVRSPPIELLLWNLRKLGRYRCPHCAAASDSQPFCASRGARGLRSLTEPEQQAVRDIWSVMLNLGMLVIWGFRALQVCTVV